MLVLFNKGCLKFSAQLCLHDVTTDDAPEEVELDVVTEEAVVEGDSDSDAEDENPATVRHLFLCVTLLIILLLLLIILCE